jgi:putative tricarboxylic transport membrane protein
VTHGVAPHPARSVEYTLVGAAVAIALLGVAIAVVRLKPAQLRPKMQAPEERGIEKVLANKYYVDEAYDATIVRPIVGLSRGFWRFIDRGLIDGAVNGLGYASRAFGWVGSRLQTGYVNTYAFAVVLGALLLLGTTAIAVAPSYSRVGPRVFPFAIAGGLMLLGLLYTIESWKGAQTPLDEHDVSIWPIAMISAGIVADALLLERLGFILSSTILFMVVAVAFGSRRYLRDAATGLALASLAYVTFVYGLGLRLPAGILAGWS